MLYIFLTAICASGQENPDFLKIKSELGQNKSKMSQRVEKKLKNVPYYITGDAGSAMLDEEEQRKIAEKGFKAYMEAYLQDLNHVPFIRQINRAVKWVDENIQLRTGNIHIRPLYAEGLGAGLEYKIGKGRIRLQGFSNGDYGLEMALKPKKGMHTRVNIRFEDSGAEAVLRFGYKF